MNTQNSGVHRTSPHLTLQGKKMRYSHIQVHRSSFSSSNRPFSPQKYPSSRPSLPQNELMNFNTSRRDLYHLFCIQSSFFATKQSIQEGYSGSQVHKFIFAPAAAPAPCNGPAPFNILKNPILLSVHRWWILWWFCRLSLRGPRSNPRALRTL